MYLNYFLVISALLCFSVAHEELTKLKQVEPRSFPYVATIQSHEWCHGILITKNYVLTNARCVVSSHDISVYVGWYSYPEFQKTAINESDSQNYTASKVIPHPDYVVTKQYWAYQNDIALVKLAKAVSITGGVRPARLADPKTFKGKDLTNHYATVFGWWPAKNLSAAKLQIRSQEDCKRIFGRSYLSRSQFCAKWPKGKRLCSHHSLPMEIDGKIIGLQQDDPQNDIDCRLFEYKFINIVFYYDWIKENSDLGEWEDVNNIIENPITTSANGPLRSTPSAGQTTPDVTENSTEKPCKIDIHEVCPVDEEN